MQRICNSVGDSVNRMRALTKFLRRLLDTIKLTFYKHILLTLYDPHLVCLLFYHSRHSSM